MEHLSFTEVQQAINIPFHSRCPSSSYTPLHTHPLSFKPLEGCLCKQEYSSITWLLWRILSLTHDKKIIIYLHGLGSKGDITPASSRSQSPGTIYYIPRYKRKKKKNYLCQRVYTEYTYENNHKPNTMLPENIRKDPDPTGMVIWVYVICRMWLVKKVIMRIFNFYKKTSARLIKPQFQICRDYWISRTIPQPKCPFGRFG